MWTGKRPAEAGRKSLFLKHLLWLDNAVIRLPGLVREVVRRAAMISNPYQAVSELPESSSDEMTRQGKEITISQCWFNLARFGHLVWAERILEELCLVSVCWPRLWRMHLRQSRQMRRKLYRRRMIWTWTKRMRMMMKIIATSTQ